MWKICKVMKKSFFMFPSKLPFLKFVIVILLATLLGFTEIYIVVPG